MKRQRFYWFVSFAQNTDVHMSGKRRNSTIGPKWEDNFLKKNNIFVPLAEPRLSSSSSSIVSSPSTSTEQSNYFRKLRTLLAPVTTRSDKHACGKTDADRSWQAGHGAFTDKSRGLGGSCARTSLWKRDLRFGRWCFKSGDKKKEAQCLYSLPQRPKLRHMLINENYDCSVQKTQSGIYSTSRKVWWLDNSGSQRPQWRKWIPEQSRVRCRGTRSRHAVDTILSV